MSEGEENRRKKRGALLVRGKRGVVTEKKRNGYALSLANNSLRSL